ncbi:MAG TPA: GH92 family glycosyl hydrolase [Chitinophagaceae bacterium]
MKNETQIMIPVRKVLITVLLFFSCIYMQGQENYCAYVNPFIGTTPVTDPAILGYKLPRGWRPWSGLVFPGSSLPNAMVQLSPMTEYGSGAGYEYEDSMILSFTHTNKGHWNLCNIPVLPLPADKVNQETFGSSYSHQQEKASPAYYQVYLKDYSIDVQLTSTLRCGFHRYTFTNATAKNILFHLGKANKKVEDWQIKKENGYAVSGYQVSKGEKVYFYAVISNRIKEIKKKNTALPDGYAILELNADENNIVELKIGLSFVSAKNAKKNLEQEIGNKSFEAIKQAGANKWQNTLSAIQVKGGTAKQREMFYSSFYRSLLWPALRSDCNGEYFGADNKVVKAGFNYYTTPSLWDTYRNKDVFLSIISPAVTLDVIRSMKDIGDKKGFIPTFFHGDHAASSIAGAWLRGIKNFDVEDVYKLLLRNATIEGGARPYISEYIQKGYISEQDIAAPVVETKAKAAVSKTLEYAYDDYSVAQLARSLGDSLNYHLFMQRAKNYKNVFDKASAFMRGRLENGDWIKNFDPQFPYYEYMYREANAWQLSFYVPHDMQGLVELYGGKDRFEKKLDSFFTVPWNPSYIARNVESMIGQYCHGNQPDHEAPYAYYFIGKPEKSQRIIDTIMSKLYGIGKEQLGLSGMDDAGEMSAWYVWNALGLYTFSATDPSYIVTVPIFDEVQWRQTNGKTLLIKKKGTGSNLEKVIVDGKEVNGYFISHDCFLNGSKVDIYTK